MAPKPTLILWFLNIRIPYSFSFFYYLTLDSHFNNRNLLTKYVVVLVTKSCPALRNPMDCNPPGSSVPGIFQARTLEWVAISFSNACMHAKSLQLCPTLCDPIDSSPRGSPVPGVLQARTLEWVAISFSNA